MSRSGLVGPTAGGSQRGGVRAGLAPRLRLGARPEDQEKRDRRTPADRGVKRRIEPSRPADRPGARPVERPGAGRALGRDDTLRSASRARRRRRRSGAAGRHLDALALPRAARCRRTACVGREDVDDEGEVVEQDPVRPSYPSTCRACAQRRERQLDGVGHRLHLLAFWPVQMRKKSVKPAPCAGQPHTPWPSSRRRPSPAVSSAGIPVPVAAGFLVRRAIREPAGRRLLARTRRFTHASCRRGPASGPGARWAP